MRNPSHTRDALRRRSVSPGVLPASTVSRRAADDHSRAPEPVIGHVHLLFWGSEWEDAAERRGQIASAFQAALAEHDTDLQADRPPDPCVTTSVISSAAHTSPGDPPELLAHADVSALVANLMSKRALSPWQGAGVALYCVVLRPQVTLANGRERFAYTAYRENMRDVHCGWLFCQDEPAVIAECARKLLAEVESALRSDAS